MILNQVLEFSLNQNQGFLNKVYLISNLVLHVNHLEENLEILKNLINRILETVHLFNLCNF